MDDLIHSLNEALERRGLSASAASKAAVGNPSAIKNISAILRREPTERATALQNLVIIADYLGLELQLGLPNSGSSPHLAAEQEFAYVRRFDVKLSAGSGSNGDNARQLAQVAFRQDWMLQQGLVADQCVVCSVNGQSMEPLLHDGDLALIDRRKADLRDGHVYAVVDIEGDIRIKRLEKIKGGLLLRSDNPKHRTDARMGEEANNVTVIGRLAWSGHTYDPMKPALTTGSGSRSTSTIGG